MKPVADIADPVIFVGAVGGAPRLTENGADAVVPVELTAVTITSYVEPGVSPVKVAVLEPTD